MFPNWDKARRDERFAELRKRQAVRAFSMTPAERLARADELLAFAREHGTSARGRGTDETPEQWRAIRASLARWRR